MIRSPLQHLDENSKFFEDRLELKAMYDVVLPPLEKDKTRNTLLLLLELRSGSTPEVGKMTIDYLLPLSKPLTRQVADIAYR